MQVWNRQDWTWRLTAILGLVAPIALYASALLFLSAMAPIPREPDDSLWMPDLTADFVRYVWVPVLLWVLMLVRRQGAWLWGGLWALVGAGALALAGADACRVGCLGDAYNLLTVSVGVAALVSSQIWLAVDALTGATKRARACKEMSGEVRGTVWRRARLLWVVLVGVGGVVVLPCALFVSVFCLLSIAASPWPDWAANLGTGVGLVLVAVVVVLLWRELITTGRTWLWWLVLWASCLVVMVLMLPLITVDLETLRISLPLSLWELRELAEAACWIVLFLLPLAEVWVALKARQLQSGQVARDSV